MMSPFSGRILAIDPGTREMGVAVLESDNLIYHGVIVIPHRRSPKETLEQGHQCVMRLLTDFHPALVVVEQTFIARNRSLALLNVFANQICALARENSVEVLTIAPNAVKKAICGYGWASKAEVAEAVIARFPELHAYQVLDRKWKERFHANMFDAVALGLAVTDYQLELNRARSDSSREP